MIAYHYRALDSNGKPVQGQLQAESTQAAIQSLQQQRLLVIEVSDQAVRLNAPTFQLWAKRGLDNTQQQLLMQQLGVLLKAGMPLDRALAITSELPEAESSREMMTAIRQDVRSGSSLSVAMAKHEGVFSTVALNLIRAGEASGTLPNSLSQLAAYLEQSARLKGRLVNALIYPAILMCTVMAAVLFLLVAVVPQFEALFASIGSSLPWYTQALLLVSHLIRAYAWLGLLALVVLIIIAIQAWQRPSFHIAWDKFWLKMPVIGALWQKAEVARFCASLSVMLGQGVPMLTAMTHSAGVLQNSVLREAAQKAQSAVKSGTGLSKALASSTGFPAMALQMMQAGEESGQLPHMLGDVALAYELQTEQATTRLLAVLVPALTLLMTVMVGFVILAVLLPVYDLTGNLEL